MWKDELNTYTKNGRPLLVTGADIHDERGRQVARFSGDRAFSPRRRYVATIVGVRLIYRSTDSASIGGALCPAFGLRPQRRGQPDPRIGARMPGSTDWRSCSL